MVKILLAGIITTIILLSSLLVVPSFAYDQLLISKGISPESHKSGGSGSYAARTPQLEVTSVKIGSIYVDEMQRKDIGLLRSQEYTITARVYVIQDQNNPAKNTKACLEGFDSYSFWTSRCQNLDLGKFSGKKGTYVTWKARVTEGPVDGKRFSVTAMASNANPFSYVFHLDVK